MIMVRRDCTEYEKQLEFLMFGQIFDRTLVFIESCGLNETNRRRLLVFRAAWIPKDCNFITEQEHEGRVLL